MKSCVSAMMPLAVISAAIAFAQAPPNEPIKEEIAQAYKSKLGEGGSTFIPGVRWERWRVKEIRGWKLRFKRISENRSPGVMTLKYQAVARKNGWCADYQITDTRTFPPPNPQILPIFIVEPDGVKACR
ncbi:MAG: hypothetical protein IT160_12300 [Bryobacterales bacterium]|nr:hypothetical protein [Bryobacterales bacterium]